MKVSVGDFELNCEIEGKDGAPWVTFSHALGNNLSLWDDQVVLLGDDFRSCATTIAATADPTRRPAPIHLTI